MQGWIAILYAAIVTGTDERSVFIENGGANRNAAFGESSRASATATSSIALKSKVFGMAKSIRGCAMAEREK